MKSIKAKPARLQAITWMSSIMALLSLALWFVASQLSSAWWFLLPALSLAMTFGFATSAAFRLRRPDSPKLLLTINVIWIVSSFLALLFVMFVIYVLLTFAPD